MVIHLVEVSKTPRMPPGTTARLRRTRWEGVREIIRTAILKSAVSVRKVVNVETIVGAWTGERDAIAALLDLVNVCTVGPEATYVECIARERLITVGEEVGPDSQSACASPSSDKARGMSSDATIFRGRTAGLQAEGWLHP